MDEQNTEGPRQDDRASRRRPASRLAPVAATLLLLVGCGGSKEPPDASQPPGGVGKIVFSIFEGLSPFEGNEACSGLWAVDPDGSGLMRVAAPDPKDFEGQYYPSFSPDGRLLAFEVLRGSGEDYSIDTEVSVLDPASGKVRSVATFTSSLFVYPRLVWSPKSDSALIVRGEGDRGEITRVDIVSGDTEVLFEGELPASVAWAPDGTRIAYGTARRESIWLMEPDGENRRELVRDGGGPVWSPDSRRLAFFRPADYTDIGDASLWLVDADGTHEKRLASGVQHGLRSVLWSPRGDRLIFLRKAKNPRLTTAGESDAYLLDLDSGRKTLLVRAALPLAWSQDGKRVLFGRPFEDLGTIGLYVASADGADERLVAVTDEEDINIGSYPVWQPAKTTVVPATGAMAPRKEFDFCVRRLEQLRARLSKPS